MIIILMGVSGPAKPLLVSDSPRRWAGLAMCRPIEAPDDESSAER